MKLSNTHKAILFTIVPFLVIFALEPLYRDSLYEKTLNDVPRMQLKKRLHSFFLNITRLGGAELSIVFLIVLFNLTNKLKALYIWAAFGFVCFINVGILK
jgi:hypothetical protein